MADLMRDDDFEVADTGENTDDLQLDAEDFHNIVAAPADWTIGSLFSQIGKQIDINPEFQRRGVWSKVAKSSFIESLFLNIPIPQILLASHPSKRNSLIVLDGKQRLLSILEFMNGKHDDGRPFALHSLRILKELEGRTWAEIQEMGDWGDTLTQHTQRTAVLRGWQKENTLYEIFHRLNSGSVKLSPMELRMALHPGPFLRFAIEKTETRTALHELLRLREPDRRMGDVELLIRFVAFKDRNITYKGNLKKFLDDTCKVYNREFDQGDTKQNLNNLYDEFIAGIEAVQEIFEGNSCRKYKNGEYESRFNRAVFDIMVGSLSNTEVRRAARNNPDQFIQAFEALSANNGDFVESLETTTKSIGATRQRFKGWYDTVNQTFGTNLDTPDFPNV
tara:strand:+ start:269 stop:1444 length:1176 start_codon:yes stop_codon:yes gene_type:complete